MVTINAKDYSWVDPQYLGISLKHIQKDEGIEVPFKTGSSLNWKIVMIPADKKACRTFEGCSIHFYFCIFEKLGVRPSLFAFKKRM